MIDVPGMWPQRLAGGTVYRGKDLKLRNGDLVLSNRDVVMVEGVQALAQAIELGIRRQFAHDTDAEPIASRFFDFLSSSKFSDHLQELTAVRYVEDQIEYEFRATGFSGAYVHRFSVRGFAGSHDCIPVRRGHVAVVDALDARLLVELSEDPSRLHGLAPRKFEEIIAALVERMGYEVDLTRYQKDDGVDIFALKRGGLAPILTVIDCKKYDPSNPIGVGLIRTLAGVRVQHGANVAMIVTTSRFTKDARDLQQEQWQYELALADFDKISSWLNHFGWERGADSLYLPQYMRRTTSDNAGAQE